MATAKTAKTAKQDDIAIVLVALILRCGHAAGHVNLAVFKRGKGGCATQANAEDDAVQVGPAGVVVLVGFQNVVLVRLEVTHREGAGADRVTDGILRIAQFGEGDAFQQMFRPDVEGGHIVEDAAARPHEIQL